jgi:hypothetical protein
MLFYSLITVLFTIVCGISTESNENYQPFSQRFDQVIFRVEAQQKFLHRHPITDLDKNIFSPTAWAAGVADLNMSRCSQELADLLNGTQHKQKWAMKLIDAWGKPLPSGLLTGNLYWMGNYDECLDALYQTEDKSFLQQPFDSQYCKYLRDLIKAMD